MRNNYRQRVFIKIEHFQISNCRTEKKRAERGIFICASFTKVDTRTDLQRGAYLLDCVSYIYRVLG